MLAAKLLFHCEATRVVTHKINSPTETIYSTKHRAPRIVRIDPESDLVLAEEELREVGSFSYLSKGITPDGRMSNNVSRRTENSIGLYHSEASVPSALHPAQHTQQHPGRCSHVAQNHRQ